MTIDERLDRLTERHEALTLSVELLVHEQHEWWEKSQVLMAHMLESVDSLARIAHLHERRISDLEGGQRA
jgi:uncharacterized phage-like protein YoqJ